MAEPTTSVLCWSGGPGGFIGGSFALPKACLSFTLKIFFVVFSMQNFPPSAASWQDVGKYLPTSLTPIASGDFGLLGAEQPLLSRVSQAHSLPPSLHWAGGCSMAPGGKMVS